MIAENDNVFERCLPNDPNRCQSSGQQGQCPYKAKPNSKFCPRHSSMSDTLQAQAAANMYRLQQYQNRMSEFAGHDQLKNLRGELGIMRMTLEQIINQCKTGQELVAYSGKIADMTAKIAAIVKIIQRLDTQLGMTLDRDKVMIIGQKIVEIIGKHVPDQSILDLVGEDIVLAILEVSEGKG